MINLNNKSDNILNSIDAIFLYALYNLKQFDITYDNFLFYIDNYSQSKYNSMFGYCNPINPSFLSVQDIGYNYGLGYNTSYLFNNNKVALTMTSGATFIVNDVIDITVDSFYHYNIKITEIINHTDNVYTIIGEQSTFDRYFKLFPLKYADQFIYSPITIDSVKFHHTYNVTLSSIPTDSIEYYNNVPIHVVELVDNILTFSCENEIKFDTTKYFKDTSDDIYSFTYNTSESDKEILSILGYENINYLSPQLPYINNSASDWKSVIAQIYQRYEFLIGYYTAIKEKTMRLLYRHENADVSRDFDTNTLNNIPVFNYDSQKFALKNEDVEIWYNDVIDFSNHINLKIEQSSMMLNIIKTKIDYIFNIKDNTTYDFNFLLKSNNTYSEIITEDNIQNFKDDMDYTENDIFDMVVQHINANDTMIKHNFIEKINYNDQITLTLNMTDVFEYYLLDNNIDFYNVVINNVSVNSNNTDIQILRKLLLQILSVDISLFGTMELYSNYITSSFENTNIDIITDFLSFLSFIGFYSNITTYNTNDYIQYNNSIYYCKIDNSLGVAPGDKTVWSFIEKCDELILNNIYSKNTNEYHKYILFYRYMNIIDRLILVPRLNKDVISEYFITNDIIDYNLINGYSSHNWYAGPMIINDGMLLKLTQNVSFANTFNRYMLEYAIILFFDKFGIDIVPTENNEYFNVIDAFNEIQPLFVNVMLETANAKKDNEVDTIKIVKQDQINDFISKLNDIKNIG